MGMKVCPYPFCAVNIPVRIINITALEGMRFRKCIFRIDYKLKNQEDKNKDAETQKEFINDFKYLHN
jgi:hypothetical protein